MALVARNRAPDSNRLWKFLRANVVLPRIGESRRCGVLSVAACAVDWPLDLKIGGQVGRNLHLRLSVKTRPIAHHRRIRVLAASAPSGPVQSNFAAAIRLDVGPPSPPMLTAPTTQAQGPNPAPLTPIPHPLATHFAAISRFSSRPFLALVRAGISVHCRD